tara:strand:+ start:43 stop:534 length:492 start_codon:yes stop_codon:yes gene_type:complete
MEESGELVIRHMTEFGLLCALEHNKNEHNPDPVLKGYPDIYRDAQYFVVFNGVEVLGYTSYNHMGEYIVVGNTYVMPEWRSVGLHRHLLRARNRYLSQFGQSIITVLNPLADVKKAQLRKVVSSLCYWKVGRWEDVEDIMDEAEYMGQFYDHETWRLDMKVIL